MTSSGKKGHCRNDEGPTFTELLKKQCPWHPTSKHSAIDCYSMRRVMQDIPTPPPPEEYTKKKDKGKNKVHNDEEEEGDFQTASKTINVMFGGIPGTASKRASKLVLREIMAIEPTDPISLKWSE